jgi:hypothetical protein
MTRATRKLIFYTLLVLFLIGGTAIVLYAEGWRIDFQTRHIEKIGGIYVRSFPENTSIYLNGAPIQNQSGFLNGGTLISDLLPRTYRLTLKAAGFDTWQENAAVSPSQVTPFKYAVLVPQFGIPASSSVEDSLIPPNETSTLINPNNTAQKIIIGKNTVSIFDMDQATTTSVVSLNGKSVSAAWITGSVVGILQNDGELYLYDINAQTLTKLADDTKSFASSNDGSLIATLEEKSIEVFSLTDSSIYYRFNIPNIAAARKLIWYKDKNHLFVVYPDSVSFLDLTDSNLINFTTIGQGTSAFYDSNGNSLYLINPGGKLRRYDFSS